ncbi:MAG: AAA family ATPase [Candidatus Adiutrix sp.]|jgi:predicted ATPase|nr:AAA family ATPase [Candidatus Adiutrix sp.]
MSFNHIKLRGLKSILDSALKLTQMNILIGPNGAGKSNFINFFDMLRAIGDGQIQLYTGRQGGPDAILHFGRKCTQESQFEVCAGRLTYMVALEPTQNNKFLFTRESLSLAKVGHSVNLFRAFSGRRRHQ